MTEVKILIQGFTNADTQDSSEEKTCPTITLIKDKNFKLADELRDKIKSKDYYVDDTGKEPIIKKL